MVRCSRRVLRKSVDSDIPQAPRLYESLRLFRTSRVQAASMENKTVFTCPTARSSARETHNLAMLPPSGFLKQLRGFTGTMPKQ